MRFFMIKRCLMATLMVGCVLQSCQLLPEVMLVPTPAKEASGDVAEVSPAKPPVIYNIKKGAHSADFNPYKQVQLEHLRFAVTFDSTAIYSTLDFGNQGDINKLYGLSDCSSDHHTNSARFGWRWYNGKLELHAYIYHNKVRTSVYIGNATLGQATICEIRLEEEKYVFTASGKTVALPRSCIGVGAGYQLYPYFGGDETAPHDISISIQELL